MRTSAYRFRRRWRCLTATLVGAASGAVFLYPLIAVPADPTASTAAVGGFFLIGLPFALIFGAVTWGAVNLAMTSAPRQGRSGRALLALAWMLGVLIPAGIVALLIFDASPALVAVAALLGAALLVVETHVRRIGEGSPAERSLP